MMTGSTKTQGLANPDLQMPPFKTIIGGDDKYIHDASKVNVQQQSGVSPSALVVSPTTASAALEGQLSSGFHPSALAS